MDRQPISALPPRRATREYCEENMDLFATALFVGRLHTFKQPDPQPGPATQWQSLPGKHGGRECGFQPYGHGSNFSATCVVLWNGSPRPTQIVSSTRAVATIAPSDVAAAGTATVNIVNTSTGLKSNTVTFVTTSVGSSTQHQATLFWTASSSPVIGYNVYRGAQAGGPYTLLNTGTVTADTFADATVLSGQTYYYVVTAVSNSDVESIFSNEAVGVIPTP